MTNPQLSPLEVNPQTGEPFLRLRKHKNIIITPPRKEDTAGYVACLNDERIYQWLLSPPFPYLQDHAEEWSKRVRANSDEILSHLASASSEPHPILVTGSPVRAIREVNDDGTDTFIGDIDMTRVHDGRFLVSPIRDEATEEEKEKAVKRNTELPLGDKNAIFTIGYYLMPSHHGRGIMTDVLDTLLWEWAVPRMGVRKIRASVWDGNTGSARVFEKNGLKVTQTVDNFTVREGKTRKLHLYEWEWDG